jgi:TolA-binding protein
MNKLGIAILALSTGILLLHAQDEAPNGEGAAGGSPAQIEARATRMIDNAVELLANNEESRAVGMLEAVPRMFADTPSRFRAHLELGRHLTEKRQFDRAAAELRRAYTSEDTEVQAESLLLLGRCQLARGDSGDAAMILRRVTQDYPTSLFANDAFFTIGQIHFEAARWARAAEAFEMVGTAVPADDATNALVLAEAGQRIFVHVTDKDLAVLAALGESDSVELVSRSGDREKSTLVGFGRGDGDFLASVLTVTEPSKPYDGKLTVQGSEEITVHYVDQNTESGAVKQGKSAKARIVSTGALAFMDGAQRQRVRGVFADQPAFLRLRDLDLDKTPQPDSATVTVKALYRERPEVPEGSDVAPAAPAPDAPWLERGKVAVTLKETEPRSGLFVGRVVPRLVNLSSNAPIVELAADEVAVQPDDKLVAIYEDGAHLRGEKAEMRKAEVVVLVGGSTEPQSIVAHASDAAIQARKLLLEAKLLHKWGNIFKEVGLNKHAADKAEEGLLRVDELMTLATRFSLDRKLVEEAFAAKWDLKLVQGNLTDAIATCRALVRLYPDTTLADRAFMQIGNARMQDKKDHYAISSAIQVYNAILSLPSSPLKAEAQFRIGEAIEQQIKQRLRPGEQPDFASAMVAFKRCAEAYPESAYAGDSFKRVIDYYLNTRDYARCVETLERVFQDYPDAPWLDEMLLKWGVVHYRMGHRDLAQQKFQRLVEEYPGGQAARQAAAFLQRLNN